MDDSHRKVSYKKPEPRRISNCNKDNYIDATYCKYKLVSYIKKKYIYHIMKSQESLLK